MGNQFIDCKAKNIDEPFLLRGKDATDNFFQDCESIVTEAANAKTVGGHSTNPPFRRAWGNISIKNGPSSNIFSRVWLKGAEKGIYFQSYIGNQGSSDNNIFENCIFEILNYRPAFAAIKINAPSSLKITNTKIINCNFISRNVTPIVAFGNSFIQGNGYGESNQIINSIVYDFQHYAVDVISSPAPEGTITQLLAQIRTMDSNSIIVVFLTNT